MNLSNAIAREFAKSVTAEKNSNTNSNVRGTIVTSGGAKFVRLDGSDALTPISEITDAQIGDRVLVTIENHTATIIGNYTYPTSARATAAAQSTATEALSQANYAIVYADTVVAGCVKADELEARVANIGFLKATELNAELAILGYVKADELEAEVATFGYVKTDELEAEVATLGYATVGNLEAAVGRIATLESTQITTEQLNASYASIDFANIGEAALKKIYSETGIIKDIVVSNGSVTGELAAVTINGDLIKAGTVIADKLVVKGSDGILYKLNVDAAGISKTEAPTDTLHGSVITAKSIVAGKIDVDDLVAFGATIGGFNITTNSIYSGVKNSMTANANGIYLDTSGKMALGNNSNYLKYDGSSLVIAGTVNATKGSIGGFTIDGAIYYGSSSLGSAKGVYLGTDGISCGENFEINSNGQMYIRYYDADNKEWIIVRSGDFTSPFVIEKEGSLTGYLTVDYTGIYRDVDEALYFQNDFYFDFCNSIGTLDGPTGHHYIGSGYYIWGINSSDTRSKIIGLSGNDNVTIGDETVAGIGIYATMYFPTNAQIGTTSNPTGDHLLANNKSVRALNSSGTSTRLIGFSTDDVIYIGQSSAAASILVYNNIGLNARASVGTSENPSGNHYLDNKRYIYCKTSDSKDLRVIGVTSQNYVAIGDGSTSGIEMYTTMLFPNNSQIGTNANPSGSHVIANDKFIYGVNTSGASCKVIGLTSGNNVQIGNYNGGSKNVFAYIDYQYGFYIREALSDHSDHTDVFRIIYNKDLTKSVVQSVLITNNTTSSAANVVVGSTGILYKGASSSKRYKEAITEKLSDSLDPNRLYDLPVVEYVYKDGYLSENDLRYKQKFIGFIAENVDDIYPLATNYNEDGSVESWNVNIIVPAMLKLIQDQHAADINLAARIDSTSSRVESLQNQLHEAMLEIASLRKEIDILKAA